MVQLITDSSANLPTSLTKQKEILVLPLSYTVDGVSRKCTDTAHFDGTRFYEEERRGMRVQTSGLDAETCAAIFRSVLKSGKDILYIGLSSALSDSLRAAEEAWQMLKPEFSGRQVLVFDSLATSLGEGLLVLHANDCLKKGMSLSDTVAFLEEVRARICQVFTVSSARFLGHSGHISRVEAIGESAFNIRPVLIAGENGEMITMSRKAGRRHALKEMAEEYAARVRVPERQIVGIAHAGCPEDASVLAQLLIRRKPPRRILTVEYEPVAGSRLGPGTVALFFESDESARSPERPYSALQAVLCRC